GLLVAIAFAIFCKMVVLPALGGETISARCPLPIGMIKSITRVVSTFGVVSKRKRWFGYSGVSLENCGRLLACSGSRPLTVSTRTNWLYLRRLRPLPCEWVAPPTLTWPVTASPERRPKRRTRLLL